MQIINVIEKHQVKFSHTVAYRLKYDVISITLSDQEEACCYTDMAYIFACIDIHGTDIKKCQEAVCKNPGYAYYFAKDIPGADIEYCRKACEYDKEWLDKFDKMIAKKNANNKRNRKTSC